MESKYLVSVIIPVHNTELYLKKCVESVRNQTLKEIEIILVDNLSTDKSSELCDEYAALDERIKVLHLPVADVSMARNEGIKMASAPFLGFIDSDDFIKPTMYSDMLNEMSDNSVGVVYCNYCLAYEDNHVESVYSDTGSICVRSSKDVQRDIINEKVSSSPCTKLFRKDLYKFHTFPTGVFFEDHATIYRWMGECDKIVWIDKSYYFYYQRSNSTCHTINAMKRYHYFLAEYARLEYVREKHLFEGQELYDATDLIVENSLWHLNLFLGNSESKLYPDYMKDMRKKIKAWLFLSKDDLTYRNYKRIRKIVYFWWLYCRIHSSKKHE